jgi:predicted MPP superfamily phosphohydrolase
VLLLHAAAAAVDHLHHHNTCVFQLARLHTHAAFITGTALLAAAAAAAATQIICITMMALALAEDSISKRERYDAIVDELRALPEKMKSFMKVGFGVCSSGLG